jgi:hypothetical protein
MSRIEIGTLRDCLSLDLQEQVQAIVDHKQEHDNYYILIYSDVDYLDPDRINTKIFTLREDMLPAPMLGTICVYVDNRAGRIEPQWSLPLDIPTKGVTDPDKTEEEAGQCGKVLGNVIVNVSQ